MVDAVPQIERISLAVPFALGLHTLHARVVRRRCRLAVVLLAVLLDHGLLAHGFVVFVRLRKERGKKRRK
jgi:hypothetical protein